MLNSTQIKIINNPNKSIPKGYNNIPVSKISDAIGNKEINYESTPIFTKKTNWSAEVIDSSHKLYALIKEPLLKEKNDKKNQFDYLIDKQTIFKQKHYPDIYQYIKENLDSRISLQIVNRIKNINSLLDKNDTRINLNSLKYFILFSKNFIPVSFLDIQLSNNGNIKCKWEKGKNKLIISFFPNESISYAVTMKSNKKDIPLRIFTGVDNLKTYIESESKNTSEIFNILFYDKK